MNSQGDEGVGRAVPPVFLREALILQPPAEQRLRDGVLARALGPRSVTLVKLAGLAAEGVGDHAALLDEAAQLVVLRASVVVGGDNFGRLSEAILPPQLRTFRRPGEDTLRLLLVFASDRKDNAPSKLDIDDLDAPLVGAFLNDLEQRRKNSVRTRNARLAAVRSLFRCAALRHPEHASAIERVLAIPPERFERRLVTFLKRYGPHPPAVKYR